MKKIRIVDVATHAGVSKSTVSQYLNGRFSHMSAETKEKIKLAIEDLNYVPNPIARSLKVEKTKTIGVIVRDIAGYNTGRVLRGIDDHCKKNGYNVLIYNSDFDEKAEYDALQSLKQLCVDGIIMTASGKNSELINQLQSGGLPIVQFQLEYPDCVTHAVVSDYKNAAFTATEYLIALGHKNICFITQRLGGEISRNARYQGYLEALKIHGLEANANILIWDRNKGFETPPSKLVKESNPPTAIFTQHLAITIEILKTLDSAEISIPQQISILGFDEIPMIDLLKVPITVIEQDTYQIGVEAGRLVIDSINNKVETNQRITVPCKLIKRNSCLPVS